VLNTIIEQVKAGTLGGESFALTLENGGLVMDYNPDYQIPAAAKAAADEAAAGIAAGTISVFGEATAPAEEPAAEAAPLTFGVVLVGPKNDHGWSQAHAEGAQFVMDNLPGSEAIIFESLNSADKPEATLEGVVDDMVAEGATLILTTSDEFEEDTLSVAQKYPDITFINVSGDDAKTGEAPPNLGNVMGRMEDMKAVAGCAAALSSDTGSIGYLGPLINFETRRLTAAAFLGAKYCNENLRAEPFENLTFTVTWIGFWFNIPTVTLDPTEVVTNFFDTGTDVVLSGIDTTEAIDIAGQRAAQGDAVHAIPYDYVAACELAPDVCLGVPFFSWGPAYLDIATAVSNGTWAQSWDWLPADWDNLTDPALTNVGWVSGPGLSAEAQASLDEFVAGMASGEINVWTGPINLQDGSEYVAEGAVATDDEVWYLPQLLEGMDGPSE
jgi:simple sugar transport system substrate-binding protein